MVGNLMLVLFQGVVAFSEVKWVKKALKKQKKRS
jgi:hypothetical protein